MSVNPNDGGGLLILGTQPLDYWLSNFAFMLADDKQNRLEAILAAYQTAPGGLADTLFCLECMADIVRMWNGGA